MKFRMRANGQNGTFDRVFNRTEHTTDRLTNLREFEQRIDEVGHLIDCRSNLLIELFALIAAEIFVAEKLGIGDDRRQWVPEVMGYGTRRPSDGREPF